MTIVALVLSVGSAHAQNEKQTADAVLRNGIIYTVRDEQPTVEALAIRKGRILAVGSEKDIEKHIGESTTIIDLNGRMAIPGFIEGHGHFVGLGEAKMNLDLSTASNWGEIVSMVANAVKRTQPGEWIVGRGWHQEKWDETPADSVEGFPTHHSLSEVSPKNPVLLTHASGHASCCNAMAMDISEISGMTKDPPGGEILRDDAKQPIGVFRETAQGLIAVPRVEQMSAEQRAKRLNRAIDLATMECLSKGVTSFHDAGSTFPVIDALIARAESNTLSIRLWVMVREPNETLESKLSDYASVKRIGENRFTLGGVKVSLDGALGARGAWLLEPYSDSAQSTGLQLVTMEQLETAARMAMQYSLQMCVHAIGDRANREVLDLYERLYHKFDDATKEAHLYRPSRDLRWRVEHAQHLHPDDIPRFGKLGVIPAMQGVHCTSDGPWVFKRLGDARARSGAYMWRDLLKTGAIIANGTDAPVEDVDPIASFHASVTRQMPNGETFFPGQSMSRQQALRSYTIDAAYAAFEEDIKGTLESGKLADIVVLSKDIMQCPADEIRDAKVDMTILGGEVVFSRLSAE